MRISRSHSLGRRPFRATLSIRNVFFYRIPPYELSTCYVWPASRERVVSANACGWVGDHTSFNLLAGASFLFLSSSGAFSRRVLYKEMQGIGKVAMRTVVAVVAVRAMHISRAGVGPLQGQSPLVRDSLGGFGHRQIHHARRAGRGRSRGRGRVVSVERTLVTTRGTPRETRGTPVATRGTPVATRASTRRPWMTWLALGG
jgi:hypothetical protein